MACFINIFLLLLVYYIILNIYIVSFKRYTNNIDNIEEKITSIRRNYKYMLKSGRITVDLCQEKDKLGSYRSNIHLIGNNCEPWIARECIYVLDHILSYNTVGLEWSSGSSTIWLGYRIKSLISIENSYEWGNIVRNITERLKLNKRVSIYYFGEDELQLCNNEKKYISSNKKCYKNYVMNNKIDNKKYDYISVDGRARSGCILRGIKLLKPNYGILLLDNSERSNYQWAINIIPKQWNRFDFSYSNGVVTMWISHSI